MKLQGNRLLKIGVPLLLVVIILILVRSCGGSGDSSGSSSGGGQETTLTREELDALGISGDSPQDTVATLVGRMNVWQQQREADQARMEELLAENRRLAERAGSVDQAVSAAIREEREQLQQAQQAQTDSLLSRFEERFDRLTRNESAEEDVPIGLGLEGGGGPDGRYGSAGLRWVEPMDRASDDGSTRRRSDESDSAFPTSFRAAAETAGDMAARADSAMTARVTGEPDAATVEPVYTLPENATLMGSLGMTALLGRVPVNGTVNDPYPFKVMIGRDNLTANGIELPEVQAAVASGTATGDWTLSCVRGNIESLTFVFRDGTIRTVPTPADVNEGGAGNRGGGNQTIGGGNSIGWLSDQYGIPCISGVRRSNARQYLGTQSLLTAAGAGVATLLSDDDSTSVTSVGTDGTVTQAMTGNQAVGQILSQGVGDMSNWVSRLYGEAFAAVYVPPGERVAIHINKQLPIDYETEGRRVRYDRSGAVAQQSLD